jgi:1-aminocyclopropane-1-carboxylate deaminase/D-cysteine desulfhydrase
VSSGSPTSRLEALRRLRLAPLPTPLEPAPRLSAALDADVWLKRDDVGSVGLAGNKVRKLELLLGDAVRRGVDTVVTSGAAQSNHARATAAACARLGLRCHLVLEGSDTAPTANLLLDRLFGADLIPTGPVGWEGLEARAAAEAERLRESGARVALLPLGGSTPLGALGFALAYLELGAQLVERGVAAEAIVHASTSGGTHAGLLAGRAIAGGGPTVLGVAAAADIHPDPEGHHGRLAAEAAALVGLEPAPGPGDVVLDRGFVGPGYGELDEATLEAIDLLARTEGVLCDPVYSGKALAAVVEGARRARWRGPVVLWHTGGWQAAFAPRYAEALWAGGRPVPPRESAMRSRAASSSTSRSPSPRDRPS